MEDLRAPRSARLRVAVLFSGALVWPNVEQTWKTWHDRLVAPHRAAVFVYASADQVRLPTDEPLPEQRTTLKDTTPKLVQRLGGTQANASTICGHVAALMGDFLVRCKVGKGLVDGASAPNPLVPLREFLQYSKLCLADRLRRAFEHDFVVRARLDMFLWQAVAMPKKPGARPAAWMLLTPPLECHACARHQWSSPFFLADQFFILNTLAAERALCSFVRGTTIEELTRRKPAAGLIEPQLLLHMADNGVKVNYLNVSSTGRFLGFDGIGWRHDQILWLVQQTTAASHCVHQSGCRADIPTPRLYQLMNPAQDACHRLQSKLLTSVACTSKNISKPTNHWVARAIRLNACIDNPNRTACPFEGLTSVESGLGARNGARKP